MPVSFPIHEEDNWSIMIYFHMSFVKEVTALKEGGYVQNKIINIIRWRFTGTNKCQ